MSGSNRIARTYLAPEPAALSPRDAAFRDLTVAVRDERILKLQAPNSSLHKAARTRTETARAAYVQHLRTEKGTP